MITTILTAVSLSVPIWLPIIIGLLGTALKATKNPVAVAVGEKLLFIGTNLPGLMGWEKKMPPEPPKEEPQ